MDADVEHGNAVGRFAPSPTGRMHLGNVFTALLSWLSVKRKSGKWILRIEDLDVQRSRLEYARMIEDDLLWLGLEWDEGGVEGIGANGPYRQSLRGHIYQKFFEDLQAQGLTYACKCRRSDILATQAPHQSDGRVVYSGRCRPQSRPPFSATDGPGAIRLFVPDKDLVITDGVCGIHTFNLAKECGDFVLRRADGAWAYQLAVVVDDALMGVTEVVRGNDLLLSAAQQAYLYDLLGMRVPEFVHIPLLCNSNGQRLSKRDESLSMQNLRTQYSPEEIIGIIAHLAGITPSPAPCNVTDLLAMPQPEFVSGNIIV